MSVATEADVDVRAFDLLKELVALTSERWIHAGRFSALAQTWAPETISSQVRFLTQIKGVLRSIPVQAFPDADARFAALNALQEALDTLIEREEEDSTGSSP